MTIEILRATDNSNAPTIEKGDIVFVTQMAEIGSGGMYCVLINGQPELFRAHKQITGQVLMTQDSVKSFEMKLSTDAFNEMLFGKVSWICKQVDHSLAESLDGMLEMLSDREELVKSKERTEEQLDVTLAALSKAQSAVRG